MSYRMFQSRLARFHDNIRRKLTDNNMSLIGNATDCIRVRLNKNQQGDVISRIVEDVSIIPIVFPPLVDIPYRRIVNEQGQWQLTTLPAVTELFPIQVYSTQSNNIYVGDLVFRILRDSSSIDPIVLALEITEAMGTWGGEYLIYSKFNSVFYNGTLPTEVLNLIVEIAERRLALEW